MPHAHPISLRTGGRDQSAEPIVNRPGRRSRVNAWRRISFAAIKVRYSTTVRSRLRDARDIGPKAS